MSEREQKTSEMPAVGASGSIGIRPNGFFAKLLEGAVEPAQKPMGPAGVVEPPKDKLPDRG